MKNMFSFYSIKGGSGKTTLALNMYKYAKSRGLTASLIDLDPQQSCKDILNDDPDVYGKMPDKKPDSMFVFFDFPPQQQSLPKTDILIPVLPGKLDLNAVKRTMQAISKQKQENQNIYILLNCYDERRKDDQEIFEALQESFTVYAVRARSVYRKTLSQNKTVFCDGLKRFGGLSKAQNEIGYIFDKIFFNQK